MWNLVKSVFLFSICCLSLLVCKAQCLSKTELSITFDSLSDTYNTSELANKDEKYIESLSKLVTQYQHCPQLKDSTFAKIYHTLGRMYMALGQNEKAIFANQMAIKINLAKRPDISRTNLCNSYHNLGRLFYQISLNKKAISYFEASNKFGKANPEKASVVARNYLFMANVYHFLGDFQNSIMQAEKGIEIAKVLKSDEYLLKNYLEKIQSNILLKDYINAKKDLDVLVQQRLNVPDVTPQINTLYGRLYLEQGQYNQAIKYYKISFNQYLSLNASTQNYVKEAQSQALVNIGYCYQKLGQNALCDAYYQKALHINDIAEEKAQILIGMADNLGINQNYTKAISTVNQAFALLTMSTYTNTTENKNKVTPSIWYNAISNKKYYFEGLRSLAGFYMQIYKSTKNKDNLKLALQNYQKADLIIDLMREEQIGYQSKLFWRNETRSFFEAAIEACYLAKNTTLAFYFLEKSRATLLNDKINTLSANQLLNTQEQLKEQQYQQQILDLNLTIANEPVNAKKEPHLLQLANTIENQQVFLKQISAKYPNYHYYKYNQNTSSLADLQKYLAKHNQVFISYFRGDSAQYQLITTAKKSVLIKQRIQAQPYLPLQNGAIKASRIIISPDGEYEPVDTLKHNGQFLLEKYAFSYTYSATIVLKNTGQKADKSLWNQYFGVAPVQFNPALSLASLPNSDLVLAEASRPYFGSTLSTNSQAVKANFLKNAPKYAVVQLFTHANADSTSAEPQIFFADAALRLSELESVTRQKNQLLILSACKTNVGKLAKGEGTLSLARGFAGAGIPATITTLWAVENETTAQIMNTFHQLLADGYTKDVALQKAKLQYLKNAAPDHKNTDFWGAFILIGKTEPLALYSELSVQIGLMLVLFSLLVGVFLAFKYFKKPTVY